MSRPKQAPVTLLSTMKADFFPREPKVDVLTLMTYRGRDEGLSTPVLM